MRGLRAALVGLALVGLTACSALPPGSGPSSPGPLPSVPATPADGRPRQPVPDVLVPGMTDPPPGSGASRYAAQRFSWEACGGRVQCATVRAPLDWSAPDGQALTLTVGRLPATASPRLGSLFINPGGPGGSGLDYLRFFDVRGLERYDIVSWDPRGVGRSTPVQCSDDASLDRLFSIDSSPDDAAEAATLNGAVSGFGQDCLRRSGALLSHISTADTVRDLDLLRGLVGDAKLHYFGSSYGTDIGAQYAEAYPRRTGPMVLDGAVDLGGDSPVDQLQGFERALDHFATWCAEQRCRLGSTRTAVLDAVSGLLAGLDAAPLPGSGSRRLTQQLAVSGIDYPLYAGREGWPVLARALADAVGERAGGNLLALADASNERGRDGRYSQFVGAFPAIRCLDSQATSVAAADRKAAALVPKAPVLGPSAGPDLVCPLWPVPPAPAAKAVDAAGVAAPIVVVGTTGDPATPYEWAKEMRAQLRSSVLITFAGEGHLAYDKSPCVRKLVQGYLVEGRVPADGSRC